MDPFLESDECLRMTKTWISFFNFLNKLFFKNTSMDSPSKESTRVLPFKDIQNGSFGLHTSWKRALDEGNVTGLRQRWLLTRYDRGRSMKQAS